ncbi:fatty acyl-CoA hydrolase precursor, medium chain [Anabrus simplex]|uniref:fatty acyl-CoA hydrolase precursor, medium chain n=1 Tax=Anabrus simplex TaxID=316456 RepID=UPI0035A34EF1
MRRCAARRRCLPARETRSVAERQSTIMRTGISLCLVTLCLAARSNKDPPTVTIPDQGPVAGREILVTRAQRAIAYLGIPYAAPPVRFAPPRTRPLPEWQIVRNASVFGAACPQSRAHLEKMHRLFADALPEQLEQIKFDEDCLFLNIFIPDGTPPPDGWPVMVWFHPGDFVAGAASLWDGSVIAAKQKVIIVTVAYRLNIFGFLVISEDGLSPGNYGLLDQVAALDWIQKRISVFGGSPGNVCIYGYDAGGISVGLHILSPLSAGKFTRAIAMSGNALVPGAITKLKTHEDNVLQLATKFDCDKNPRRNLLACLRRLDAISLAEEASDLGSWGPVVDYDLYNASSASGAFLPKSVDDLLADGHIAKVDFMAGYTDMEDAFYYIDKSINWDKELTRDQFENLITEVIDEELEELNDNDTCPINQQHVYDAVIFYYSPQPSTTDVNVLREKLMDFRTEKKYGSSVYKQATYISKVSTTFLYRFDYKPKKSLLNIPDWAKVPHECDIPFVWGMPYWPSLSNFLWNNMDRKFAEHVMMMWANFAKYSNPIQTGFSIKWEPFTEDAPGFMILDRNFNMSDSTSVDYKAFNFWNSYYPKVKDVAKSACCNMTAEAISLYSEHYVTKFVSFIAIIQYLINS